MNFFVGLLIIGAGFVSIYYSDAMVEFGRIQRAENNLGGTRAFYVLIGFLILVVGLMVLFGLVNISGNTESLTLQGVS